jgi:hypothetical protein
MTSAPAPDPRVTFGVIVLNGEPFTRYTLRALYPYAHQIVVVEGAAPAARNVATADGHSRDGTLEVLRRFKAEEDPDGKVVLVTAEDEGHPDGFWPGEKDEQSAAYARRATGDYLWQVDIDEFYRARDMELVLSMLREDRSITGAGFPQLTFWGGTRYWVDGWYLRRHFREVRRLFRWGAGFTYLRHRPPTVLDAAGRDVRDGPWVAASDMARRGAVMLHYSLLFPAQVRDKCDYYASAPWAARDGALDWAEHAWMRLERPYRVHNVYAYPSWLERYEGDHPEQIERMIGDLVAAGRADEVMRPTDDIERLLRSPSYRLGRTALKVLDPVDRGWRAGVAQAGRARRLVGARLGRR